MLNKPLLIVFIGMPGSGKTYFASRLAEKIEAVRINSDAMRLAIFGSHDRVEEIRASKQSYLLNSQVFGAMHYSAKQILERGHSVIYEAQQTKRRNRREIERIADECGAIPVLIWVQTNVEVAKSRGVSRDATDDTHRYTEEKMEFLADHFTKSLERPQDDENVIVISGEVPFKEQYREFKRQLSQFTGRE